MPGFPFNAPNVDWGLLSQIPDQFAAGQQWRESRDLDAARKKALAGPFDPQTALNRLLEAGDLEGAAKISNIAGSMQPQEMTPYQAERIAIERERLAQRGGAEGVSLTAPRTATVYDEQGRPFTAAWNAQTGQWDKVGGAKGQRSQPDPMITKHIDTGLGNLLNIAKDADTAESLEPALGPLQGADPDSMIGAGLAGAARFGGEITNYLVGGTRAPTEIRANIRGSTEALAVAIKPLIRSPGEGVWTNDDQARLVSIVGDLPLARNLSEFKRRLNAVRDRVKSNFGLDLKFDAEGGEQGAPRESAVPARRVPTMDVTPDGSMTPTPAPAGAQADPVSQGPLALPRAKSQLQEGQVYNFPDGRQGLWNGREFEVF